MGGARTHWLKGGWYGRMWETENENEKEKGKRTAEYNGGVNEWSWTTAIEF